MLLETRGGLQREKHELETTGSSHARGKPASTWKATPSYDEEPKKYKKTPICISKIGASSRLVSTKRGPIP